MIFELIFYAHQYCIYLIRNTEYCIYLIRNTVKAVILCILILGCENKKDCRR